MPCRLWRGVCELRRCCGVSVCVCERCKGCVDCGVVYDSGVVQGHRF